MQKLVIGPRISLVINAILLCSVASLTTFSNPLMENAPPLSNWYSSRRKISEFCFATMSKQQASLIWKKPIPFGTKERKKKAKLTTGKGTFKPRFSTNMHSRLQGHMKVLKKVQQKSSLWVDEVTVTD